MRSTHSTPRRRTACRNSESSPIIKPSRAVWPHSDASPHHYLYFLSTYHASAPSCLPSSLEHYRSCPSSLELVTRAQDFADDLAYVRFNPTHSAAATRLSVSLHSDSTPSLPTTSAPHPPCTSAKGHGKISGVGSPSPLPPKHVSPVLLPLPRPSQKDTRHSS